MIGTAILGSDPEGTVIMLDKVCAVGRIDEKPARAGEPVFAFLVSLVGGINVLHEVNTREQAEKDRNALLEKY